MKKKKPDLIYSGNECEQVPQTDVIYLSSIMYIL